MDTHRLSGMVAQAKVPLSAPGKRQISTGICRFSVMIALRQGMGYEMLRIVMIGLRPN